MKITFIHSCPISLRHLSFTHGHCVHSAMCSIFVPQRQGHKTRKSFSHKDNRMGNYKKQQSLGFTQQLQHYILSRDTGLNKTNSAPEGDCSTKHNKHENPQQQQEQRSRTWIHKEDYNRHRPNNRGRHFTRRGQHQAHCNRRDFSRIGTNTGGKKVGNIHKIIYMLKCVLSVRGWGSV